MRLRSAALSNRPDSNASQKHPTDDAAMGSLIRGIRVAYSAVQSPMEVSTPTYRKNRVPKNNKEGEYQLPAVRVSCSRGEERSLRIIASHNPRPTTPRPSRLHGRS